jgi:hypothetical protein
MRFAYADPPYFGCCGLYDHHHPDGRCWDDIATHGDLLNRLLDDFPDGWALSASSTSLRRILPLCPADVRIAAWVKPFASFKPNVNPAYTWEPVMFYGGRRRDRSHATTRDHVSVPITLKKGLTGAKPPAFCYWLFDLLGAEPEDEFIDLYEGTGIVSQSWQRFSTQGRLAV